MSLIDAAQKKAAATAKSKGKVYEAKNTYNTGGGNSNIENTSLGEPTGTYSEKENKSEKPQKPVVIGKEASKDYGVYPISKENEFSFKSPEEVENLKARWAKIPKGTPEEEDAAQKAGIDFMENKEANKAKEYIYKKVGEGKVEKIEKK